jgi:hypothetical protein
LAAYPNMDRKTFKTFNEFYENLRPRKVVMDMRSQDEIMEEIADIEKQIKAKKEMVKDGAV